jgi:hypothetical protein
MRLFLSTFLFSLSLSFSLCASLRSAPWAVSLIDPASASPHVHLYLINSQFVYESINMIKNIINKKQTERVALAVRFKARIWGVFDLNFDRNIEYFDIFRGSY